MKTNLTEPMEADKTKQKQSVAGCVISLIALGIVGYSVYIICSL